MLHSQNKQKCSELGAFKPRIMYVNFQSPEKKNLIGQ